MLKGKRLFTIILMLLCSSAYAYPPCFDAPCVSYDKATISYQIDSALQGEQQLKITSEIEVSFKIARYRGDITNQIIAAKPLDTTITLECDDDSDCETMDGLNRHAGEQLVAYNDYLSEKPYLDLIAAKHFIYQAGKEALFTTTNSLSTSKKEMISTLAKSFIQNLILQGEHPIVYVKLIGKHGLTLHLKLELKNDYWQIKDTVEEGLKDENNQLTVNFNQNEYEAYHQNRPWAEHFLFDRIRMKQCGTRTITSTVVAPDGSTSRVERNVTVCWYEYR
ncbi:hypothetical protein L2712_09175 [Shewanella marisflavi]|uniref:hypothetical protein n=1 Tax=Shewanella marisflavi TaxID=260364 RepID=UPI00200D6DD2|nr:hypothetical protein [Shewanella marisflavi]MCL1041811.1 hypothetical protein [Shewanella marisflavi]